MELLLGYGLICLLVAARLGWHMWFKLDAYDWYYHKLDHWLTLIVFSALWPLLYKKPGLLRDPTDLFQDSWGIAARQRERDRLWYNPPPCGAVIRYRQEHGRYEETYGEFLFRSQDVEAALRDSLRESPHLKKDDEGALLNWVCRRDEQDRTPADVPDLWWRFQHIADDLLRAGKGEGHCLTCGCDIELEQLTTKDDRGLPGWNFNRLLCPQGHVLLAVERIHFYMG